MGRNMSDFPIPASIELISQAMINKTTSFQISRTYRLDLPLQQFQDISSKKTIFPLAIPKWVGHLGTIMRSLSNLDAVVGHLLTSTTWTKWTSTAITTIIATIVVVAESSIGASAVTCTACENPRATTPCGNSRAAISCRTLRAATSCWDPRPLSPTRIQGSSP